MLLSSSPPGLPAPVHRSGVERKDRRTSEKGRVGIYEPPKTPVADLRPAPEVRTPLGSWSRLSVQYNGRGTDPPRTPVPPNQVLGPDSHGTRHWNPSGNGVHLRCRHISCRPVNSRTAKRTFFHGNSRRREDPGLLPRDLKFSGRHWNSLTEVTEYGGRGVDILPLLS